jgi:hypothetical protein
MCKYCGKNIDFEKLLNNIDNINNIDLHSHIINDKSYMKFVSMLNQLKGYGQYDMHGSVVNAPRNLNLVQKLLP